MWVSTSNKCMKTRGQEPKGVAWRPGEPRFSNIIIDHRLMNVEQMKGCKTLSSKGRQNPGNHGHGTNYCQ